MKGDCSHTFSPEYDYDLPGYEYKGDDQSDRTPRQVNETTPGFRDGAWHCPHDAIEGKDKCIFHLPIEERPDDRRAVDTFLSSVSRVSELDNQYERRRALQFIDAEFEEFDLEGELVGGGSNYHIDLSHAEVHNANLNNVRVIQPMRCFDARFVGEALFEHAHFEKYLECGQVTFAHEARFRGAVFHAPARFAHAEFADDVWFWYAVGKRFCIFRNVDFRGYAYFRGIDFVNYSRFSQSTFHDEVTFKLAEFGDDADFIDVQFKDAHTFVRAEFNRTTNFTGIEVNGPMNLSETSIEQLQMAPETADSAQYVDLRDGTVESGTLSQPTEGDGDILYDVAGATLGDVRFVTQEETPVVDRVRFLQTNFNGFEFENDDMRPETTNWQLHTVFNTDLLPEDASDRDPSFAVVQGTYLRAKNGAKQVGNTTAAGEFYYKEMAYKRKHHATSVCTGERSLVGGGSAWLGNCALMATTGYGEKPLLTVGASLVIVVVFAGLFHFALAPSLSPPEALLFSFQNFITFLTGAIPQRTTLVVTAVSLLQGFLGAFFVALFVYVFTRRLNR